MPSISLVLERWFPCEIVNTTKKLRALTRPNITLLNFSMQTRCNGERYRKVTGVTLTVSGKDPYKWGVIDSDELEFLPKDLYDSLPVETSPSNFLRVLPGLSGQSCLCTIVLELAVA